MSDPAVCVSLAWRQVPVYTCWPNQNTWWRNNSSGATNKRPAGQMRPGGRLLRIAEPYTPNMLNVTDLSTLNTTGCLYTDRPCLSFIHLRPSHNFLFLNNQTRGKKAHLYRVFLHQTQSKRDGNVSEKTWWTLFTLSPVSDLPVRPSTQRWAVWGNG